MDRPTTSRSRRSRSRRRGSGLWTALPFLLPNIIGVAVFTIFPVVFALVMAFTNWDLRRHNMFRDEPLEFVWLSNFIRLLTEDEFLRYLGNTLFLMMGIPFAVAGALGAAMLLSRDTRGGGGRMALAIIATGALAASVLLLTVLGMGATGMTVLLAGVGCGIILMGTTGGNTVYRTLFYMPHFVMGVPTFLLWKHLYNPDTGPINASLRPVLSGVEVAVGVMPENLVRGGMWVCFILMFALAAVGLSKLRRGWRDGEFGSRAVLVGAAFLLLPAAMALVWGTSRPLLGGPVLFAVGGLLAWQAMRLVREGREFDCRPGEGGGTALMLGLVLMVGQFIVLGLAPVFHHLPDWVGSDAAGLAPPNWIYDYHWAKPSLMIVALWGAIGSNNMLLYLAALTNVSQDLYEAADIDGAGWFQKFWNVTWPQLAPTTFFIAVMSTISGLQGGFEMARAMTEGGPAGATTTMSYYIYEEGFSTGRLSFASAVSWALFLMIFLLTLVNWRFGNRYVND